MQVPEENDKEQGSNYYNFFVSIIPRVRVRMKKS